MEKNNQTNTYTHKPTHQTNKKHFNKGDRKTGFKLRSGHQQPLCELPQDTYGLLGSVLMYERKTRAGSMEVLFVCFCGADGAVTFKQ